MDEEADIDEIIRQAKTVAVDGCAPRPIWMSSGIVDASWNGCFLGRVPP